MYLVLLGFTPLCDHQPRQGLDPHYLANECQHVIIIRRLSLDKIRDESILYDLTKTIEKVTAVIKTKATLNKSFYLKVKL